MRVRGRVRCEYMRRRILRKWERSFRQVAPLFQSFLQYVPSYSPFRHSGCFSVASKGSSHRDSPYRRELKQLPPHSSGGDLVLDLKERGFIDGPVNDLTDGCLRLIIGIYSFLVFLDF